MPRTWELWVMQELANAHLVVKEWTERLAVSDEGEKRVGSASTLER